MPEYDFHQLSPHDFENLTRDLLQADMALVLETFKIGKDGGIDFRYARSGMHIIVQCKHYVRTGLNGLLRDLRKEAVKVRKLKPKRYILATSVALTHLNKDEIAEIIGTDVLQVSDILGQDDLNNRLGIHTNVEDRHYKLWLASRAVLDRVLHNAEVTQSEFQVQKIYKELPRYVQSSAYPKALAMLGRDRLVIVAGPPGVGKTTLANLLLYQHIEQKYQAIVIQGDIREGKARFQSGAHQIFYYDDFMGTTFLGDKGGAFHRNEDRVLTDFISMVHASPTARMILTTREHILSQALERSERFRHSEIGDHKVVLQIADYNFGQRAEILYNHLYFSELPAQYQDELLRGEFYLQIIKHPKFNPRLIEWLSTYRRLKNIGAAAYRDFVQGLLDDPAEIWRHAYENEISDAGRSLLLAVFSLGGKTGVERLEAAFKALHKVRAKQYGFQLGPNDFKIAFRELVGAFIKSESATTVNVLDPSVLDLVNAVVRDAPDNAMDLICGAVGFDQIEHLWSFANSPQSHAVLRNFSQNIGQFVTGIEPRLLDSRKVDMGGGNIGFVGVTFERRLAVAIEMADHFQHSSFLTLISNLFARTKIEWQAERVNTGDGVDILRAFNRINWSALDTSPVLNVYLESRNAIVNEMARGCPSDHLRDAISALPIDEIEDVEVLSALQKGVSEYRRNYFSQEVRECRSSSQFEGLIDDLETFQSVLDVQLAQEIAITQDAQQEFEEHEEAYADHMQDELKGRHFEELADERSVREMFGSLNLDRPK